jgi:hypothetical protein
MSPKSIQELEGKTKLVPLYEQLILKVGEALGSGVLSDVESNNIQRLFYYETAYLPGLLQLAFQESASASLPSVSLEYALQVFLAMPPEEQNCLNATVRSDLIRAMLRLSLSDDGECLAVESLICLGCEIPPELCAGVRHLLESKRNRLENLKDNLTNTRAKIHLLSIELKKLETILNESGRYPITPLGG